MKQATFRAGTNTRVSRPKVCAKCVAKLERRAAVKRTAVKRTTTAKPIPRLPPMPL